MAKRRTSSREIVGFGALGLVLVTGSLGCDVSEARTVGLKLPVNAATGNPETTGFPIVVNPGETSDPLHAIGCETEVPLGPFGNPTCLFCIANCDDQDQDKVNVNLLHPSIILGLGRRFAQASIWSDFEISASPGTLGNLLPCSINYDVSWNGSWGLIGSFSDINPPAEMRLTLFLEEVFPDETREMVTTELVQSTTPNSVGIDVIEIGGWKDVGQVRSCITCILKRGHRYRITLELRIEVTLVNPAVKFNLDYLATGLTPNQGAKWNNLTVSVAQDPEGIAEELRSEIEALKQELLELINNHAHPYLTGHGEGHNNTEATTGVTEFP